jgi:hypothetical protein
MDHQYLCEMDHQYLCETITNSVMQYLGSHEIQDSRYLAWFYLGDEINHTKMPLTDRQKINAAWLACDKQGLTKKLGPVLELQRLLSSYDRETKIGFQIWSYVHWSRIELDAAYAAEHDE